MKSRVFLVVLIFIFFKCSFSDNEKKIEELQGNLNSKKYDLVIKKGVLYLDKHKMSYKAWNIIGQAFLKKKDFKKSEKSFSSVINLRPDIVDGYYGMAAVMAGQRKYQQAIDYYVKISEITPDDPKIYLNIMVMELKQENFDIAIEYGLKAMELDKNNPVTASNLSIAYHFKGDSEARDYYFLLAKKLGSKRLPYLADIFTGKRFIRK